MNSMKPLYLFVFSLLVNDARGIFLVIYNDTNVKCRLSTYYNEDLYIKFIIINIFYYISISYHIKVSV
jgi:hypothetical protein